MNKLGYKQKGIPMLKSPLNIDGVTGVGGKLKNKIEATDASKINTTLSGGLTEYGARIKAENTAHSERAAKIRAAPGRLFDAVTGGYFTPEVTKARKIRNRADWNRRNPGKPPQGEAVKNSVSTNSGSLSPNTNSGSLSPNTDSKLGNKITKIGNLASQVKTTISGGSNTPPPPPPKGGRSFKDAYAKRDMKTYGNLSQAEYTTEAKRQLKGGKVPGSKMEGGNAKGSSKTNTKKVNEGPGVNKTGKITQRGTKYLEDGSVDSAYKNKSKKIVSKDTKYLEDGSVDSAYKKSSNKKPAAKIKSNKDIRKEKRANIKGGMSRQEARLKKTQSKAANEKAKTNKTIKSIDPTKAKSADTGAKQTSAKSTRATAKRLEKRAERLKGRVNASKVSK